MRKAKHWMKFWQIFLLTVLMGSRLMAQESYCVVEAHSGKILTEVNADLKRPVASLAKIATAMVVLDWAKYSGANMGQMVGISPAALKAGGSNPMAMVPGDQISLREAMYSMLLGSDNVAAHALSDHVGRSIASRSGGNPQSAFVKEMNHLAKALGMTRTRFRSPHGHSGTSTARDITRLCIYAARNTGFLFYVKQKSRKIASYRGGQSRKFTVQNTNSLVGRNGIQGIKAASSAAAGPCLALSADKSPLVVKRADGGTILSPRRLVVVILGSPDRLGRGTALVQQGWAGYGHWRSQGLPVVNPARELIKVPNP